MKKLLILMLAAVLALSLAACGGGNDTPSGEHQAGAVDIPILRKYFQR